MKKRLISSCLCFMALLMIMVSGCKKEGKYFIDGDFLYCYINEAEGRAVDDGKYIAILEVSKQGEQKKTLIIPEEIDGKKVIQIGYRNKVFMGSCYYLETENSKFNKLILPKTIQYFYEGIPRSMWYKKVIFKDSENLEVVREFESSLLSRYLYEKFIEEYGVNPSVKIANVEYVVDGAVYFVDDYGEGEIVEAPPEPVKEGYAFDGWYTEESHTNKWNFEENTFKLEEGQTVKSFYAKFNKIN